MSETKASPKPFASSADLADKTATLEELADGVYAFTAEGDPNVGAVVGRDGVLCVDARATPTHAREWLQALRQITDLPVRYLFLTHYHAVRVLGASAFDASVIMAHEATRRLIDERGEADFESEARRFPRLFRDLDSVPGLTHPTMTFTEELRVSLGDRDVILRFLGRGHTEGDAVVWLPGERVLFAGDLVEAAATPYCGDAFLNDWRGATLDRVAALDARALVPGRGPAVSGDQVGAAISETRDYLDGLCETVGRVAGEGGDLKAAFGAAHAALAPRFGDTAIFEHCMPFNVARAYDELAGARPRVWTAERDRAMWDALQG
jgi:glyoxylase-like metal-dependent hydrolase (beta-lactamase superfamily II)